MKCNSGSKYFAQRYRYFMQYELGIKFDEEAWYSVTPEAISEHQASRCATPRPSNENRLSLIFDAFCGVGGNSISFAKKGFFVIACDVDPTKVYKVCF
jgi:trimethylguanosine synthase